MGVCGSVIEGGGQVMQVVRVENWREGDGRKSTCGMSGLT